MCRCISGRTLGRGGPVSSWARTVLSRALDRHHGPSTHGSSIVIRRVLLGVVVFVALVPPMVVVGRAGVAPRHSIEYMPTRSQAQVERARQTPAPSAVSNPGGELVYGGGPVEVTPNAYLVVYGSQWKKGDPENELPTLTQFLRGLAGPDDTWSTVMTQYCQGGPTGAHSCGTKATRIVHPTAAPLAKVFLDVSSPAPKVPTTSDFAHEAARAAVHFGNRTTASNQNVQYIIATARNFNADGAGTDYCAWHDTVPSKYGALAYTNLPYIPQLGWNCGAGFVNRPGPGDGITVVAGHEFIETATDPIPNSGWVDKNGNEIADKCAWIVPGLPGGGTNISLSTGTFPVQALWSNGFGTSGGCTTSYASPTMHH
jgi:hypothetical protein